MNKILVPIVAALLIIGFILSAWFYNNQKNTETSEFVDKNKSILVRDHSPTIGNKNAKVTIVEFFDPACETCKAFHPFVKHLMKKHQDKIKLVMRYTPLHSGSDQVVKILEAANLQNKFWEILEATYASQAKWTSHHEVIPDKVWMYLGKTSLDFKQARQDMNSNLVIKHINQDIADANQLKVNKTPGYFVNGKPLLEFGYQKLQDLIENEIRIQYQ